MIGWDRRLTSDDKCPSCTCKRWRCAHRYIPDKKGPSVASKWTTQYGPASAGGRKQGATSSCPADAFTSFAHSPNPVRQYDQSEPAASCTFCVFGWIVNSTISAPVTIVDSNIPPIQVGSLARVFSHHTVVSVFGEVLGLHLLLDVPTLLWGHLSTSSRMSSPSPKVRIHREILGSNDFLTRAGDRRGIGIRHKCY